MKTDLDALQGCWNMVSVEVDGQEFPPGDARIVIAGARFVSLSMGAEFEGTVELDEGARPKSFDLRFDKGPHAGKLSLGIYKLQGDDWTICMGLTGVIRPERFVTGKGTGHALETLRRGKEQARKTQAEAPVREATELEGEWRLISCVQNGKPLAKSHAEYARRVFAGNQTTLFIGDSVSAQSRFRLSDGEIDYLDLDQLGIYELSGSSLKIAMGERGAARPVGFSAEKGDRRTFTEWKWRARTTRAGF